MSFPIQLTDGTVVKVTHRQDGLLVGDDGTLYRRTSSSLRFEPVPTPTPVEEYAPAQVEDEVVDLDVEYTFDADGKAVPVADQDMIGTAVGDVETTSVTPDLGNDLSLDTGHVAAPADSLTPDEENQEAEWEEGLGA